VLFAASLIIVSNFAIDLMYGWIDPRIRTAS
jgi:ABC-type dipeptide/oligopeptide/nickel transport system permease component